MRTQMQEQPKKRKVCGPPSTKALQLMSNIINNQEVPKALVEPVQREVDILIAGLGKKFWQLTPIERFVEIISSQLVVLIEIYIESRAACTDQDIRAMLYILAYLTKKTCPELLSQNINACKGAH